MSKSPPSDWDLGIIRLMEQAWRGTSVKAFQALVPTRLCCLMEIALSWWLKVPWRRKHSHPVKINNNNHKSSCALYIHHISVFIISFHPRVQSADSYISAILITLWASPAARTLLVARALAGGMGFSVSSCPSVPPQTWRAESLQGTGQPLSSAPATLTSRLLISFQPGGHASSFTFFLKSSTLSFPFGVWEYRNRDQDTFQANPVSQNPLV